MGSFDCPDKGRCKGFRFEPVGLVFRAGAQESRVTKWFSGLQMLPPHSSLPSIAHNDRPYLGKSEKPKFVIQPCLFIDIRRRQQRKPYFEPELVSLQVGCCVLFCALFGQHQFLLFSESVLSFFPLYVARNSNHDTCKYIYFQTTTGTCEILSQTKFHWIV